MKLIFKGRQAEAIIGYGIVKPDEVFDVDKKLATKLLENPKIKELEKKVLTTKIDTAKIKGDTIKKQL